MAAEHGNIVYETSGAGDTGRIVRRDGTVIDPDPPTVPGSWASDGTRLIHFPASPADFDVYDGLDPLLPYVSTITRPTGAGVKYPTIDADGVVWVRGFDGVNRHFWGWDGAAWNRAPASGGTSDGGGFLCAARAGVI